MKVVIDTSVLVSAAFRDRTPEEVILFVTGQDAFHWIVSGEILAEYQEVLSRPKFDLSEEILNHWIEILESSTVEIGSPEIMLAVGLFVKDVPNSNDDWIFTEAPYDLKKVDKVRKVYTAYQDTITQHGLTEHINGNYIFRIRIWEQDGVWNDDDEVCRWSSVYLRSGSRFLSRWPQSV